jgi:hypothetical protein
VLLGKSRLGRRRLGFHSDARRRAFEKTSLSQYTRVENALLIVSPPSQAIRCVAAR